MDRVVHVAAEPDPTEQLALTCCSQRSPVVRPARSQSDHLMVCFVASLLFSFLLQPCFFPAVHLNKLWPAYLPCRKCKEDENTGVTRETFIFPVNFDVLHRLKALYLYWFFK